jgi:hypothetical protein
VSNVTNAFLQGKYLPVRTLPNILLLCMPKFIFASKTSTNILQSTKSLLAKENVEHLSF